MSAGDLDGDRLGDGSGCHSGGRPQATDVGSRWVGGRQAEKWVLFEYVRAKPQGTPLSKIVSDVFGDVRAGSADYQLARRFFRRRDDLFLVENRGDLCYVEPRPAAFGVGSSLEFRSKEGAKTQEGEGAGYDTSETGPTAGRDDGRGDVEAATGPTADCCDGADGVESRGGPTAERFPKDRARRTLSKRTRLDGGDGLDGDGYDYRADVFRELARYRDETDDKWQYFERLRGAGSRYLVLPYLTRYNDGDKARDTQRRYRGALRRASCRYSRAAVVSLTVGPNRFESHSEATEAIRGAVSKWLQRESYQLGGRPDNLKVLDFQRNGLPHYHVVLFGVEAVEGDDETATGEPTLSTGDVRQYWDERADVGREVDVRPAYYNRGVGDRRESRADLEDSDGRRAVDRDDVGAWILHDDEGGRVSLGYYLGKRIRGLVELAETDTGDLFEAVEAGDLSLWRHALFWAYEARYCTVSPSLRADRDDGLPAVRIWRYVGACRFDQIPRHVLDDGVVCRTRPPPD